MLQFADRVQETTVTSGTGSYALGGAAISYQSFSSVCDNDDTCFYGVTDGTNWEVGLGTYGSSGDTLARTTIFASSNSNEAVNWGSAVKNIWLDVPAHYFTNNSITRQVTGSGTITQLATDRTIVVQNNTSAAVNVDLLAAASMPPNGDLTVVDGLGYAGTNNVTLVPNGEDTINGQPFMTFDYNYQWAKLTPVTGGWVTTG